MVAQPWRRRQSGRRPREGQALIEFVFTMPFLLFIFLAVIEVSRVTEIYTTITRMAGDTAILWSRRDRKDLTPTQVQAIVNETLEENGIDLSAIAVNATTQADVPNSLTQHVVTITYTVELLGPESILRFGNLPSGMQLNAVGVAAAQE